MSKNILLIITDQQRKDSLGCYGNKIVNTPNIDSLAKKGVQFNRYYCTNPICMPNRLCISTGMYPRNHGVWTNGLLLKDEVRTLATELKDNGFQTTSFGKIHYTPFQGNGGNYESSDFWRQKGNDYDWHGPYWGFQNVELTIGHTQLLAHYGKWFKEKGGTKEMMKVHPWNGRDNNCMINLGVRNMPASLHDSSFVGDRTVDFIKNRRKKDKPFFAVASFPDPHAPFNPPKECADKYSPEEINKPLGASTDLESRPKHYLRHFQGGWHRKGNIPLMYENGIKEEHANQMIALYYAMVDLIDQNVGKIIDALKDEDILKDTIVIFTSDHGELLGDYGLWLKGPFFYEGLINIPLIIYSEDIQQGVSQSLMSSVDIMPTILDLLGIKIPYYVNGISQKEHLMDLNKEVRDKCLVEYRNGYGKQDCSSKVLVTKDMKYVRYQTGECELTDLKNDSQEMINVANEKQYKKYVNEMNELLLDEILSTENMLPDQISHA